MPLCLAGVVFYLRGEGGAVSGAVEKGSPAARFDARGSREQHRAGPRQPEGQMGSRAREGR